MPDTPAERQARRRKHLAGDHSECNPSRCRGDKPRTRPVAAPAAPVDPPPVDGHVRGGIERSVAAFVAALGYADEDPRSILGEIAVQLARRVDESGALPAAVRELRTLLAQIAETPNDQPGQLDQFRVDRERRRVDTLIRQAS